MAQTEVATLKYLIDVNGPNFLRDHPYEVYQKLLGTPTTDDKTSRAILFALVSNIDKIAFPKNPDTNILKSNFLFSVDVIPPNTESNAATIDIAKYDEYVYGIIGIFIPIIAPIIQPTQIANIIIVIPPLL